VRYPGGAALVCLLAAVLCGSPAIVCPYSMSTAGGLLLWVNKIFGCDYCVLLTVNMLCHVEVMFIQLLNLLERYYVYLHYRIVF